MEMHPFYLFLDPYLIRFFRITGYPWADFLIGTLVLALLAVIIGEITISLAFLAVKKRSDRVTEESRRYQNLSMDALKAGDKQAYAAANKMANDAFGHSFFMQIALSAAFLWPIFFALAWMEYRFAGLEFSIPFTGYSLGYIGVFILLYVPACFAFKKVKHRLPYFRGIKKLLDVYDQPVQAMKNLADLLPPVAAGKPTGKGGGKASP